MRLLYIHDQPRTSEDCCVTIGMPPEITTPTILAFAKIQETSALVGKNRKAGRDVSKRGIDVHQVTQTTCDTRVLYTQISAFPDKLRYKKDWHKTSTIQYSRHNYISQTRSGNNPSHSQDLHFWVSLTRKALPENITPRTEVDSVCTCWPSVAIAIIQHPFSTQHTGTPDQINP